MILKVLVAGMAIVCTSSALAADKIDGVQGKEVKFSVDSIPSTGYSWMIKTLPKELVFVYSDYEDSENCKKGMVGCSGREVFTFVAVKPGNGKLTLIHGQPFDKSSWEEKTFDVKVK